MTSDDRLWDEIKRFRDEGKTPEVNGDFMEAIECVLLRLRVAEEDSDRLDELEREHWHNIDRGVFEGEWAAWTKDNEWSDDVPALREAIDIATGAGGARITTPPAASGAEGGERLPLPEAFRQLAEASQGRWENVDPDAYVAELRGYKPKPPAAAPAPPESGDR
jgi:hypothetical protein